MAKIHIIMQQDKLVFDGYRSDKAVYGRTNITPLRRLVKHLGELQLDSIQKLKQTLHEMLID